MGEQKNRFLLVLLGFFLVLAVAIGCEPEDPTGEPDTTGEYTKCSYTSNLYDSGYADAEVYYPCETGDGPFAATTLTGGYTNVYTDMEWLADHLVTHGYIIIAMTPNNIYGDNFSWETAHKAGFAKLKSENSRSSSPIYGLVNIGKIQIMGFSKGGGGTLLASADLGSQVAATQALAPYMDYSYNISGIASPTICYTGTADYIALPGNVVDMFDALPTSIDRTLAYFYYVSHLDWMGSSGSYRDRMKTYITSWMKVYLDNNTAYEEYIDGSQSWFYQFESYSEGEDDGGCY